MCKHPKRGPQASASSKAGYQVDHLGSVFVFYAHDKDNLPHKHAIPGLNGEGWYWEPCSPGCLPDGEASGPFNTSEEAFDAASAYGPDWDDSEDRLPVGGGPDGNWDVETL